MPLDEARLAALTGSRICHDLVSPLGAIRNGLELLEMTGLGDTPECALIRDSIATANARIGFLRIAFGSAGAGTGIGRDEVVGILDDLYGGRVMVLWHPREALARDEVKLAFLGLLCIETALPRGGTIEAWHDDEGGWRLQASGPRLRPDDPGWQLLCRPPEASAEPAPTEPARIQFALLGLLCAAGRRRPSLSASRDHVTLAF